ncbi:MAG: PEP-CTERM sorting domain-containing protein, partial [Planctomycetota bacterium]
GAEGSPKLTGFEEFLVPQSAGSGPLVANLASGHTMTLTARTDTAVATAFHARNRSYMDDGACPRGPALYDNIRVSGDWGNIDEIPVMGIDIAGLDATTAYPLRIGSFSVYKDVHEILRPAGGTSGPTISYVTENPPTPVAEFDRSILGTYTTDDQGVLSVELVWDRAGYLEALRTNPTLDADTQALLCYVEVIPEPFTLGLLAVGGLAVLRRRR